MNTNTIKHSSSAERAVIIHQTHAMARLMYERGRSDRVIGLSPSLKFGDDLYYRRAYQSEMAKEKVS